jgi:hypothetical protein
MQELMFIQRLPFGQRFGQHLPKSFQAGQQLVGCHHHRPDCTGQTFPGGMSGHRHDNGFGNAGLSHAGVERVPQVMKNESAFFKSAIGHASLLRLA